MSNLFGVSLDPKILRSGGEAEVGMVGLGEEEGSVTLQPQAAAPILITNNTYYF